MGRWDPEWVQVGIATCALLAAVSAWLTSRRTYRASYRPVLRVVCLGPIVQLRDKVALKNLGRGPAFGIVMARGCGTNAADFAGEADALEPLGETYGPKFEESSRVGRKIVSVAPPFNIGDQFRVFYQDLEGDWHETRFEVHLYRESPPMLAFKISIHGELQPEDVPAWVKERSRIVTETI